jgi:hypothetical protein
MQCVKKITIYYYGVKIAAALILVLFTTVKTRAQVLLSPQIPQMGISQKQQLWDVTISNTTNAPINVVLQVLLTDKATGVAVLNGESRQIVIASGAKFFNQSAFLPIVYSVLNNNYSIDASVNGFLPFGNFDVCYSVFVSDSRGSKDAIAEECTTTLVEPLSPPLLVVPADKDSIDETMPSFNWLPPAPTGLFFKLLYDFKLVEVGTNQTPEAALQQQLPLVFKTQIASNTFAYPSSTKPLELGKTYAWQITALNRLSPVAQSDIWSFKVNPKNGISTVAAQTPFYALKTELSGGTFDIKGNALQLSYDNTLSDSVVSVSIYSISKKGRHQLSGGERTLRVSNGHNFISYALSEVSGLAVNGVYLLELINSSNEKWYAQFRYTK